MINFLFQVSLKSFAAAIAIVTNTYLLKPRFSSIFKHKAIAIYQMLIVDFFFQSLFCALQAPELARSTPCSIC